MNHFILKENTYAEVQPPAYVCLQESSASQEIPSRAVKSFNSSPTCTVTAKKISDLMSVERIESDCDGCIVMSVVNAREHNDNSICCYLVYQKCATHHLDGYPTIATLMG